MMNSAKTVKVNHEEIEKTNCKVYYIVTVHKNHPVFGLSIVLSIFHFILCFFRIEKLWLEELSNKGPEKASFARVIFKAIRTRVLISALTIILSVTLSFAAPVSINLYNSLISNKFFYCLMSKEVNIQYKYIFGNFLKLICTTFRDR
jgi:hypothetical protein